MLSVVNFTDLTTTIKVMTTTQTTMTSTTMTPPTTATAAGATVVEYNDSGKRLQKWLNLGL